MMERLGKHFRVVPFLAFPEVLESGRGWIMAQAMSESYPNPCDWRRRTAAMILSFCYWGIIESENEKFPPRKQFPGCRG